MQNHVDHLLVEVLGVAMKKTQILTENQSSIFQYNILPRKDNLVPEYLPKEVTNVLYHMCLKLCGHYWSAVCHILRKTLRN